MSLHCAATLVVRTADTALAEIAALRERRVTALYAEDDGHELVAQIAGLLDLDILPVRVAPGTGRAFVHANQTALQGISDLHRGETVVVVVDPAYRVDHLEVEIGDDGMHLR